MKLTHYPILKLLIPYIIGIFLAYFGNFSSLSYQIHSIFIVIFVTIALILAKILPYKWQWISFIPTFVATFLLGFLLTNFHFTPKFNDKEKQSILKNRLWYATITEPVVEKEKSIKVVARLNSINTKEYINEKVILYVKKNVKAKQLECGDHLIVKTQLEEVAPPDNPYAFDNQLFLKRKGIYFTGFVQSNGWKKMFESGSIRRYAAKLQKILSKQFVQCGLVGEEYAIITAILLGDDDTMDPSLKASYATAGVSHILCVSGMHVGIIYMILNFLLKPLDYAPKTRTVKAILLLGFIWFYAALTGLSPSVKRAAAMFTFVTIGSLLRRNTDIFHSLFASLFIMLIINPLLIFEVGLQLSYAAVFGIVLLQPILTSVWTPKSKFGDYLWGLTTVSISAQIATFPLSVHYFGQFPNYFLISNLCIIFLSFIIVISGVITLVLSLLPILGSWSGLILSYEIRLMNFIVKSIDQLPGSLTANLSWNSFQITILYLCILFLYLFLVKKRGSYLLAQLSLFLFFLVTISIDKVLSIQRLEMTFYSISKSSCIGLNVRRQGLLIADTSFSKESNEYVFAIKNHELRHHIQSKSINYQQDTSEKYLFKKENILWFYGKSCYVLQRQNHLHPTSQKLNIDYLFVTDYSQSDPIELSKSIDYQSVIIANNVSKKQEEQWNNWCQLHQVPIHNIKRQGALSLPLTKISK
ncbi:MAG: ComEC family competence protein [Bacteroidales bacterium]|nr:ComEC family competence protein [Bacteroidales bacterium]